MTIKPITSQKSEDSSSKDQVRIFYHISSLKQTKTKIQVGVWWWRDGWQAEAMHCATSPRGSITKFQKTISSPSFRVPSSYFPFYVANAVALFALLFIFAVCGKNQWWWQCFNFRMCSATSDWQRIDWAATTSDAVQAPAAAPAKGKQTFGQIRKSFY